MCAVSVEANESVVTESDGTGTADVSEQVVAVRCALASDSEAHSLRLCCRSSVAESGQWRWCARMIARIAPFAVPPFPCLLSSPPLLLLRTTLPHCGKRGAGETTTTRETATSSDNSARNCRPPPPRTALRDRLEKSIDASRVRGCRLCFVCHA